MDFGIRRACGADWAGVDRVHARARPYELPAAAGRPTTRLAALRDLFRGDLWVAESGAGIVGFVACVGNAIVWLYVDPRYFRRGIGRALLRHAVDHCGAIAHSETLADNQAGLALFRSEGFVVSSENMLVVAGYGEARSHRMRRVALV